MSDPNEHPAPTSEYRPGEAISKILQAQEDEIHGHGRTQLFRSLKSYWQLLHMKAVAVVRASCAGTLTLSGAQRCDKGAHARIRAVLARPHEGH